MFRSLLVRHFNKGILPLAKRLTANNSKSLMIFNFKQPLIPIFIFSAATFNFFLLLFLTLFPNIA